MALIISVPHILKSCNLYFSAILNLAGRVSSTSLDVIEKMVYLYNKTSILHLLATGTNPKAVYVSQMSQFKVTEEEYDLFSARNLKNLHLMSSHMKVTKHHIKLGLKLPGRGAFTSGCVL